MGVVEGPEPDLNKELTDVLVEKLRQAVELLKFLDFIINTKGYSLANYCVCEYCKAQASDLIDVDFPGVLQPIPEPVVNLVYDHLGLYPEIIDDLVAALKTKDSNTFKEID